MQIITNATEVDLNNLKEFEWNFLFCDFNKYMKKLRKLPNYQKDYQEWLDNHPEYKDMDTTVEDYEDDSIEMR